MIDVNLLITNGLQRLVDMEETPSLIEELSNVYVSLSSYAINICVYELV